MSDKHAELLKQINNAIEAGTFSLNALAGVAKLKERAENAEQKLKTSEAIIVDGTRENVRLSAELTVAKEHEKKHGDLLARENKLDLKDLELKLRTEHAQTMKEIVMALCRNPIVRSYGSAPAGVGSPYPGSGMQGMSASYDKTETVE